MSSLIPGDPSFQFPSGCASGVPTLLLTATSSGTAQTLHTAASGTDDVDFLTVWAANVDGSANYNVTLEIDGQQYGPFQVSRLSAPFKLLDGVPLNNSKVVAAYASVASKVVLTGKVIRVTDGAA